MRKKSIFAESSLYTNVALFDDRRARALGGL